MPWIARRRWLVLIAAAGCSFDASYQSGQTTCSDGLCPSGLVCSAAHVCVTPGPGGDASVDAHPDAGSGIGSDAHVAAMTCGDPGALMSGVPSSGTTVGRDNTVDASCAGEFMNGPDAIYTIAITASQSLEVALASSGMLSAYVLASCEGLPNTPSCVSNMAAIAGGSPITASPGSAGTYYVVVDSAIAGSSSAYTLTVTAD